MRRKEKDPKGVKESILSILPRLEGGWRKSF